LQAEILKAEQKEIELNAAKLAYIKMLQAFINVGLTDSTQLEKPAPQRPTGKELSDSFAQRPESMLFTHQYKMLQLQQLYLAVKNLPRLGLFAQGGYGRPALNMLNNDFSFYYIGGLRFSWNFTGLYTLHNDKKLLDVQRQQIDVQHELFIFNNMLASAQQKADMEKWDGLILRDKEIVQLREKIKNVTKTQLENGTATANDLSRDISAVDQARQNMALHEMQYLMAQYNYQTTTGTNQYIETK
jgi:outer membrane protein TolC